MTTKDRVSPSGPQSSVKTLLAIASTAVALTAAATATAAFPEARVGDVLTVSPRSNLNASLAVAFARVQTDDIIVIGFTNVGATTNTGAASFDAVLQQR